MTYIRYIPTSPLKAYVNHFYYPDGPMPYPRERILPLPWLDLKFNLGGPVQVYRTGEVVPYATYSDSWCMGMWNVYHEVDWPADMQFFGVVFEPGGAYSFLRLPLSELHNQFVPLDAIWGQSASEIRQRLYAEPTLQARFELLEQLLIDRLNEVPHGLNVVQYAVTEIARCNGALSIGALSDHMGISQKHLITQFKRMVGITPKELARMYRFESVVSSIDPSQPIDWTRIAHQSLYYDQSHFIKDFEAFTGYCPSDYLRLRRQVQAENPEHAQYLRQMLTG